MGQRCGPQRAGGDAARWRRRIDDHAAASKASSLPIGAAAAIAKAVTGAYLSSEGNAFSSRTGVADRAGEFQSRVSATSPADRCSACSSRSCRARISVSGSMALRPTRGRSVRRWACPAIRADSRCTKMAPSSAASAPLRTICTRSTRTSSTSTRASTKRSRMPRRSVSRRRSIDAATASPSTARRCASATSTSADC